MKQKHKEYRKGANKTKRKTEADAEGYVYVFLNLMSAYYGENVYKIGYSGDPKKRVHDFDTLSRISRY